MQKEHSQSTSGTPFARLTGIAVAVAISSAWPVASHACSSDTPTPITQTWTAETYKHKGTTIVVYTGPIDYGSQLQITSGIDDSLWVAMTSESAFLKLSTKGKATIYTTPTPNALPEAIALNGKEMQFTEFGTSCYGSITAAGKITERSDGLTENKSTSMTTGADGLTWFVTDLSGIESLTSTDKHTHYNLPDNSSEPAADVLGPDGNIWFVENMGDNVGNITPAGKVTECNVGFAGFSNSFGIATGADGRIWFADPAAQRIGAINTDCSGLTYYSTGLTGQPDSIVAGPDGNLYFGEFSPTVGRITTAGVITEFPLTASEGSFPVLSLTVGPDKNIWFSNNAHSQVGKLELPK
jgi:virginiamycin B lyase